MTPSKVPGMIALLFAAWLGSSALSCEETPPLHDGARIASTVIIPAEDDVAWIEERQADIRTVLEAVELRSIQYRSDGLKVTGYLAQPKAEGKYPAVIFNRGGNREFGALNDLRAELFLARIASWGYVVAASNYRGNAGGEGTEEFGGADVHDVLNLIPLLEQEPKADAARLGMIGWSRGGMMACLALTHSDRFKAVVIGSGAFDAHRSAQDRPEMETEVYSQLIPGFAENRTAALDSRSPVKFADRLCRSTPILILHGAADSKVNPREALDMAMRLQDANHPYRLVMFEGAEHGLREQTAEVDRLTREWFDRYVRDGAKVPTPPTDSR